MKIRKEIRRTNENKQKRKNRKEMRTNKNSGEK